LENAAGHVALGQPGQHVLRVKIPVTILVEVSPRYASIAVHIVGQPCPDPVERRILRRRFGQRELAGAGMKIDGSEIGYVQQAVDVMAEVATRVEVDPAERLTDLTVVG
jgi:hypothetical protein